MMHVCDVDLVFAAGGVDEQPSFNAFPRGKLWDPGKKKGKNSLPDPGREEEWIARSPQT